ncbi:MAG: putative signal transduction protein with domain [Planctomycetaceae bacterium]|nr:putative signal transduction protein with domain [Planctomycetaceae bacterium]
MQVAASRMLDRNVGTLVVVNGRSEPIGMITDRDLTVRVLAPAMNAALTRVGEVMTSDPQVVSETTEIEDVLRIMRAGPYRRLPVVDARGQLVGLVSLDDILDLLSEEFRSIDTLLRHETPDILAST